MKVPENILNILCANIIKNKVGFVNFCLEVTKSYLLQCEIGSCNSIDTNLSN